MLNILWSHCAGSLAQWSMNYKYKVIAYPNSLKLEDEKNYIQLKQSDHHVYHIYATQYMKEKST